MDLAAQVTPVPLQQLLSQEAPIPVIVANAARDHEWAAELVLRAEFAALVEKPLASSGPAARRLLDLARARPARLAAAHVFTYARYVERFAELIDACGDPHSIRIKWTDLSAESRYGENKSYDFGLPIFADVLPHVLSIVNALLPGTCFSFHGLSLGNGGRQVALELAADHRPLRVELARETAKRERTIEVVTPSGSLFLDFSTEPGIIRQGASVSVGDPDWGRRAGPLASMLRAYLDWTTGASNDKRLDPALGVEICQLIDRIDAPYRQLQTDWLVTPNFGVRTRDEADANYALRENLCRERVADALSGARHLSESWWLRDSSERRDIIESFKADRTSVSNISRFDR